MTLQLETGSLQDSATQRSLDLVAQAFPITPPNALGALPTTTATLPTGTFNGQDFYYALSGGGVWHFKYNLSSTKWDFAGGPPLISEVVTVASETTASATYVALTTPGPSIALPFAGDYFVEVQMSFQHSAAGGVGAMSYDIGGTGAVDADSGVALQQVAATGTQIARRKRLKTGLTAVTLTAKYRTNAVTLSVLGTAASAGAHRVMIVTPLRVG